MIHSAFSLVEGGETWCVGALHKQVQIEVLCNVIMINMIPQIDATNTLMSTQKTK